MLLDKLIDGCNILSIDGDAKIDVKKIKINSAEIEEGDCFIALVGKKSDGHKFADEAIARGAKAVVCCNDYS
ncbi:MAG: UDP-N-acetylmuramoyl-L-alanyl-D-glutamate--2,6-diaminopimelate ligase, partial [Clostridia bacterium]|nr:UDP-N-acetylmuramoyl-L-alanyl-D-glutamate--2,6-diaminopimelate ligase [Clostridia bacterium]